MIDPLKTLTSEKRPWLVDTLGNIWNYFFNYEQQKRQEKLEFLKDLLANDNLPPTQKDDLASHNYCFYANNRWMCSISSYFFF